MPEIRNVTHGSWSTARPRKTAHGFLAFFVSYFVASFLLTLTAALINRSVSELFNAQRTITLHRTFWSAEGVLEQAVRQIQLAPNPEGIPTGLTAPSCNLSPFWSSERTVTAGSYRMCLQESITSTDSEERRRYQIEATGTAADGTTQVLVSTIEYATPVVVFQHTVWSDHIRLVNVNVGSMDTEISRVPPPGIPDAEGDLATPRTEPWSGPGCGSPSCPALKLENVTVNGTLYVGPAPTNPNDPNLVSLSSTTDPYGNPPPRGNLTNPLPSMSTYTTPTGMTDLASIVPHDASGNVTQTTVIPAGIYTVSTPLKVNGNASLCTNGEVEIYMSEGGYVKLIDGKLYGQPLNTTTCSSTYSPEDLRFFHETTITGSPLIQAGSTGTIAATYYVPEAGMSIDANMNITWIGAAVFAPSFYLNRASGSASLYYDEALRGDRMRVGQATVTIQAWLFQGAG